MNLKRRNFIATTAAAVTSLWDSALPGLFAAAPDTLPDGLFESPDPAVRKLAAEVYQQCILGKVFPPRGCLKQRWIAPGGGYNGQWIWDTMFVVDLLSILPGKGK
jgi:hypothetical protein